MKENQNEEFQTRREFFKKAAKAALPVVGAVVISSLPILQVKAQYGCNGGCSSSCYGMCVSTCMGTCVGTCKTTCDSTCIGTSKSW
ncbi:MAG: Cys-Xaa-Xaa-Xaa repeat radical SAM target protein [Paludibacteraceae bacterium]|nr:Cys-Xaa-Xaa-Xaa repeat radical SAM target protein [Paludibacteraceae bacterium]